MLKENRWKIIVGVSLAVVSWLTPVQAMATEKVYVYGPGGPFPAVNEVAKVFSNRYNVDVIVVKGPTSRWLKKAQDNADIIYSGAEFMMQNFVWLMKGKIDEKTIQPLYLRPSGILVRKGNPRHIKGFEDLLKPGIRVMVVNGAGQMGLWEDMAGKQGNIETIRALRKNIVYYAHNSAEAKEKWIKDTTIDAWLIWNIWQVSNPDIADFIAVSDKYVIYRDCGVALTFKGEKNPFAKKFYEFLQSEEAKKIFKKWGWIVE